MENAAEALKIGAFVLIFVLALSITINAFSLVNETSRLLLDYNDREYESEYLDYNMNEDTNRIVGVETIIPSIYKAYNESYKIVFRFKNDQEGLYSSKNGTEIYNNIDLSEESLSDATKELFIKMIIGGRVDSDDVKNLEDSRKIKFYNQGLYERIKDKKFKESSGIFYTDDINGLAEGVAKSNKVTKRVIIYEEQ